MRKAVMQDINGNELVLFNGIWWSRCFDRFWQLISKRDGDPVMVCRLYPGMHPRFVYNKGNVRRLHWWNKWCHLGWAFFDPDTQLVYPGERRIDDKLEEPFEKIRKIKVKYKEHWS